MYTLLKYCTLQKYSFELLEYANITFYVIILYFLLHYMYLATQVTSYYADLDYYYKLVFY